VFWILVIIARWKIFTKAGEAGWKSIIPIYSDYVQWRIAWKNMTLFWVMIALIVVGLLLGFADGSFATTKTGALVYSNTGGILGLIGSIMMLAGAILELVCAYKLFASFDRGVGWFIGYIFVPNIMLLALGFGNSTYHGPQD
jgi:hypothetical protein